jgi:hypothetical protein
MADHLAGSLDPRAERTLREHVATCAACQAEHAGFERLWEALGDIPAPPVPADRMRERFSAMLQVEGASMDRRSASRLTRRGMLAPRLWLGGPLVQMAAAAALLLVGVLAGRSMGVREAAPPAEIAQVRSELRDMRQMLTLSLMQQQSATERLRGVSASEEIDRPGNEIVSALLETLLHDPNVNVRLAAVDALRRFSDRDDVRQGTLKAVTDSSSPLLQIALIDFLVETDDPQAASLLQQLSQDSSADESVRGRAAWGLERLAS